MKQENYPYSDQSAPDPRESGYLKEDPLVSVVLCVYNGENQVASAIEDVLGQTYSNLELLISDDASTDKTFQIVEQYASDSRVRIFRQEKNLGFLANKNFAIGQVRGEFITQQDHDDRSHRNRIQRQIDEVRKSGMLIVACGVRRINLKGEIISIIAPKQDVIIDGFPNGGLPFFYTPIMFHRNVWKQHGPFNEYFAGAFGEDNYFVSCALRSHPIAVISECLYDYLDTPLSVTSQLKNDRALTMKPVLDHLSQQNIELGTNDLENGNYISLKRIEESAKADSLYLAEQYRAYAARAIDHGEFKRGSRLLLQSARTRLFSVSLLRTSVYMIRRMIDLQR